MALAQFERLGTFGAVGLDGTVERISASNPPAALEAVRSGAADAAVVPIESSIEGAVPPTLDALSEGRRLQIVAETEIEVAFTILGGSGVTLDSARTVSAYPIALNQVRQWLQTAMPDAAVQSASSNAGAAEDVAAGIVDAAVSNQMFVGARAVWDTKTIQSMFLTRAEPASIGLSSIGSRIMPISID